MKNLNVDNNIKKSIKFIVKKFKNAIIKVNVIDGENKYIYINNEKYEISSEDKSGEKYDGILIVQSGENNFYEFKKVLQEIPNDFLGNGIVFIRYEGDYTDYIENQFMTYLKLNKFKEIENYILLSEENYENGMFIIALYHTDLLKDSIEYEDYEENFVIQKGCSACGGCSTCESKGNCHKECSKNKIKDI